MPSPDKPLCLTLHGAISGRTDISECGDYDEIVVSYACLEILKVHINIDLT